MQAEVRNCETPLSAPVLKQYSIESRSELGATKWQIPHAADTGYLTHGYFRYIGKLPPQLAACFVNELCPDQGLVLDPMCGGGTTLTEAVASNRSAIGFDVNPVARLISKVVSQKVNPGELADSVAMVLSVLSRGEDTLWSSSGKFVASTIDLGKGNQYFSPEVRKDLNSVSLAVQSLKNEDIKDFLNLAVLAILRKVSLANVKKMNVVVDKTKKTHKTVREALAKQLSAMMRSNEHMNRLDLAPANILDHDATKEWPLPEGTVDMVVLHPPYLTNTAFSEFTLLQLAFLGVDHKKIWKRELRNRGSYVHEPNGLKKYLVGWHRTLEHTYHALKSSGFCAIVVGDGKIDFVRIPIGRITAEFASDIGFRTVMMAQHQLNNNTGLTLTQKMKEQHVIVLEK